MSVEPAQRYYADIGEPLCMAAFGPVVVVRDSDTGQPIWVIGYDTGTFDTVAGEWVAALKHASERNRNWRNELRADRYAMLCDMVKSAVLPFSADIEVRVRKRRW